MIKVNSIINSANKKTRRKHELTISNTDPSAGYPAGGSSLEETSAVWYNRMNDTRIIGGLHYENI